MSIDLRNVSAKQIVSSRRSIHWTPVIMVGQLRCGDAQCCANGACFASANGESVRLPIGFPASCFKNYNECSEVKQV